MFTLPRIRTLAAALTAGALAALSAPAGSQAVVKGGTDGALYVNQAPNDGDYPWTVAVVAAGFSASDGHFCGGTLIAADRVLTAAHCIDPGGPDQATASSIEVIVGQTSLAAGGCQDVHERDCKAADHPEWARGTRLSVAAISLHSAADIGGGRFYNDLAQLTLAQPIPEAYLPAIVAPVDSSGEGTPDGDVSGDGVANPTTEPAIAGLNLYAGGYATTPEAWGKGTDGYVFGWGVNRGINEYSVYEGESVTTAQTPNVLTRGGGGNRLERLPDDECAGRLGTGFRSQDMLCMGRNGTTTPGPDACYGDSGGPLLRASYERVPDEDVPTTPSEKADFDAARITELARAGKHYRLMGVVSWGKGCGLQRFPGVYARVGAPALRSYVTNPKPAPMPAPSAGGGPAISGSLAVGQTITCSAGQWDGATSFGFTLWRDVNGDGSRGLNDNTFSGVALADDSVQTKLTDADVRTLSPTTDASGRPVVTPKIGCTVVGRGPGGYFSQETVYEARKPIVERRPDDKVIVPTPPTTPADTVRPVLSKSSAVCSATACRVAVIILDPGAGANGVKHVTATLVIARTVRTRVKKGKDKGKIKTSTKTIKKTVTAVRSGDQWIAKIKGFKKGDRPKLKLTATDAAGNVGTLTVGMKLRKR